MNVVRGDTLQNRSMSFGRGKGRRGRGTGVIFSSYLQYAKIYHFINYYCTVQQLKWILSK